MKAREINDTIRYTMWSVFRRTSAVPEPAAETAAEAVRAVEKVVPRPTSSSVAGTTSRACAPTPT